MCNWHIWLFNLVCSANFFQGPLAGKVIMTLHLSVSSARVLRYALYGSAGLLLALYANPAEAAVDYTPGFASGFADGLLSLLKLMASPFADVVIVNNEADGWAYELGYGLGVLTFAAAAGAAASSTESASPGRIDWDSQSRSASERRPRNP